MMRNRASSLLDVYTKTLMEIRVLHAILLFIFVVLAGLLLHGDRIHYILGDMPIYSQLADIPNYVLYFTIVIFGFPVVVLSWISTINIMAMNKVDSIVHAKLIIVSLSISSVVYIVLYSVISGISSVISGIVLFALLFLFLRRMEKLSVVRTIGAVLLWHILLLVYGAIFSMFVVLPIMRACLKIILL